MATRDGPNDEKTGQKRVNDSEGTVDQKIKSRILRARERIDDREDQLFVQAPATGVRISQEKALDAWGTSVRQYIRVVKPLLTSTEVDESDYYFKEVHLGEFEVPPPDGKKPWSYFAHTNNPSDLKREMGLPVAFDPPETRVASFKGLESVLNRHRIVKQWTIDMKPNAILPGESTDHVSVELPVPKSILESAVEETDAFLQQAGVGIEIGFQERDATDDEPF